MKSRRYNKKPLKYAEQQLREIMEKEGWEVIHKGWPDFACVKDGQMKFVEVKSYRGDMLKREQHFILTNLAKLGLSCYRWTPDDGFEQILPDTPFVKSAPRKITREMEALTPEELDFAQQNLEDWAWERFNKQSLRVQRWVLEKLKSDENFYL